MHTLLALTEVQDTWDRRVDCLLVPSVGLLGVACPVG